MCRVPWHRSPLSLLRADVARGWDKQTPRSPMHPAQPCCGRSELPVRHPGQAGTLCAPKGPPVSSSTHRQGRRAKCGVTSPCFGHGGSLPPFPGQFVVRPQLLFPACRDGECLSLRLVLSISPLRHPRSCVPITLEISAEQRDEGFVDTSEICSQGYTPISWISSDQLPRARCLRNKGQQQPPRQPGPGVGIRVPMVGVC